MPTSRLPAQHPKIVRSRPADRQRAVEFVGLIALAGVLLGGFVARDRWLPRSGMPLIRAAAPLDRLAGPEPARDPATAAAQAVGPIGVPAVCWQFQTGGLVPEAPAVAGGTVYLGSWDGSAYALDAATGATRWRFPTGRRLDAAPVVAGDAVYVANAAGFVAGLDAASGAERWRLATATTPTVGLVVADGTLFVVSGADGSRPAVAGGTVYAAGGGDRHLHAVDPTTGSERWSARLDRNGVYAFDVLTGQVRWFLDTVGPISSSPVVDGDAVYAADGFLYRIDAESGALRWQTRPSLPAQTGLAVAGSLLVATGDDGPTIVDGMGRISGWLVAVDATTGEERWRVATGGPVWSAPVVAGGVAYVGGDDGSVHALEAATGRERWRVPLGEEIFGVALAAGVVYAAGDGSVFALGDGCGEPAGDRTEGRGVAPVGWTWRRRAAPRTSPRSG